MTEITTGAIRRRGVSVQEREGSEFVALAQRRLDHVYKLAGYLLLDATEAEDCVQDALLRAWRGWPSLRDRDRFDAWLDRIVVNTARSRLGRGRRLRGIALDPELDVATGDPFHRTLDRDELGRALARLPIDQRAVVVLRYWASMQLDEIAVHLGIPLGTVKSRLHYALQALGREIKR